MLKSLNTLLLISCSFFSIAQAGKKLVRSADTIDLPVNVGTEKDLILASYQEASASIETKREPMHLFEKSKWTKRPDCPEQLCLAAQMSKQRERTRYLRSKTIGGKISVECEKKLSDQNYNIIEKLLNDATKDDLAMVDDDMYKQTVLHHIMNAKKLDNEKKITLMQLALSHGADPNSQDWYGDTPLHCALGSKQDSNVIKMLIASGANVNVKNNEGQAPLHRAGRYGSLNKSTNELINDIEAIQILIDAGSDIYLKDRYGATPLSRFEKYLSKEFIEALVDCVQEHE